MCTQTAPRVYQRKPVPKEAIQYDGSDASYQACKIFAGPDLMYDYQCPHEPMLNTSHGKVFLKVGDWIIKEPGGNGMPDSFYPCPNPQFRELYEESEPNCNEHYIEEADGSATCVLTIPDGTKFYGHSIATDSTRMIEAKQEAYWMYRKEQWMSEVRHDI